MSTALVNNNQVMFKCGPLADIADSITKQPYSTEVTASPRGPALSPGLLSIAINTDIEDSSIHRAFLYFDTSSKRYIVSGPVSWYEILNTPNLANSLQYDADTKTVSLYSYKGDLLNSFALPFINTAGDTMTGNLNLNGHLFLTGANASSSIANTSQIVFGTNAQNHIALSSNMGALVINPSTSTTTNQIILSLSNASTFPKGINASGASVTADTFYGNLTGNASTANSAIFASKLNLSDAVGDASTPVYFNANGVPVACTSYPEANLKWGGKNFVASWSPLDGAIISQLSANRFAFLPKETIKLEYSIDGGAVWTELDNDEIKKSLFSSGTKPFFLGNSNSATGSKTGHMSRITITLANNTLYTSLYKFAIRVSTNGSTKCYCTIEKHKKNSQNEWEILDSNYDKYDLSGWSGWNIINFPAFTTYNGSSDERYNQIRFTFGDGGTISGSYTGMQIIRIQAFGGEGWATPSSLANEGHVYTYDYDQNVTFPANVSVTGANKFIGNLQGTAEKVDWSGVQNKPIYYDKTAINTINVDNAAITYTTLEGTSTTITDTTLLNKVNSKLDLEGGTINNSLTINNMLRVGNTFFNVLEGQSTKYIKGIVIKTKIPFVNGLYMPNIQITGYAYGQSCPIDFSMVFYIYDNKFSRYGVISKSLWKPTIYLSTYLEEETKYVAISIKDNEAIYYPRFTVTLADFWPSAQNRNIANGWSVEFFENLISDAFPITDQVEIQYKKIASDINGTADKAICDNGNNAFLDTYLSGENTIFNKHSISFYTPSGTEVSTWTENDHYPTSLEWTAGTKTAGPTAKIYMCNNEEPIQDPIAVGAIPAASDTTSGIITADAQNIGGIKTFLNGIITSSVQANTIQAGAAGTTDHRTAIQTYGPIKVNNVELYYNTTTESLDFIFA